MTLRNYTLSAKTLVDSSQIFELHKSAIMRSLGYSVSLTIKYYCERNRNSSIGLV